MSPFPTETGCYVDGHWGQYGPARVVQIAIDLGWKDDAAQDLATRHLQSMGPSTSPDLSDWEVEILIEDADQAEAWLSEHASDDDHSWGWHDGEFFYMPTVFWEEA